MSFKIGDVVRLKSGGPYMTVSQAVGDDGKIGCQWFNQETHKYELAGGRFYPETLEIV